MERNEHLDWAKKRAIKHLEIDEIMHAWTSFVSDMGKHDKLKDHVALSMGNQMLFGGIWKTKKDCENFIEGFN